MSPELPRYVVTRAIYHQMIDAGVFGEDDKLELLEGALVPMTPQGFGHRKPVVRLTMILAPALVGRADVAVQVPFAASPISEPEPDLYIAPVDLPEDEETPSRVYCIIEIAVTSRRRDVYKASIYARAAVPQYILIDVPKREARIYRVPRGDDYEHIETVREGTPIVIDAFPDVTFDLAAVLPRGA